MASKYTAKEHAFWQSLVLPQEETRRLTHWRGKGYRWFRSANVVPIEQWVSSAQKPPRHPRFGILHRHRGAAHEAAKSCVTCFAELREKYAGTI
jgi:hypothetical protein